MKVNSMNTGVRVTGSENTFVNCSAQGFDVGFDVRGKRNAFVDCTAGGKRRRNFWAECNLLLNSLVTLIGIFVTWLTSRLGT